MPAAKLLSTDEFRAATRGGGAAPDAPVYRFSSAEPQSIAGADRTFRFTLSNPDVDLAGDSVGTGWVLDDFKRNPVGLFAHDASAPPIGRWKNVGLVGSSLKGDLEFAPEETYDFAGTLCRLVKGGYLKAVSVGFLPIRWKFSSDPNRRQGLDFLQQKLLEASICPVPCHPGALLEARSIGIDTRPLRQWAERALDAGGSVGLSRRQLKALHGQAGDTAARLTYVADLKRSIAASRTKSPITRLAEAERLQRELASKAETPSERMREARELKRILTARGFI